MKRILDFIDIYNDSNVRPEIFHRLENRDSTEDHHANNLRYFHSQNRVVSVSVIKHQMDHKLTIGIYKQIGSSKLEQIGRLSSNNQVDKNDQDTNL